MAGEQDQDRRGFATARGGRPQPAAGWRPRIGRWVSTRWVWGGVTGAAVLVVAVVVVSGQARTVDDVSSVAPGAVGPSFLSTDGDHLLVTDAAGQLVQRHDHPAKTIRGQSLPMQRLAVRPGSTSKQAMAVVTRSDEACEHVEVGYWGFATSNGHTGWNHGTIEWGQGWCVTDPVWSPDGHTVAWIERTPDEGGNVYTLRVLGMGSSGPSRDIDQRLPLDVGELEAAERSHVSALRVTDWIWVQDAGGPATAVLHLSAVHDTQIVQTATLRAAGTPSGAMTVPERVKPATLSGDARPVTTVTGGTVEGTEPDAVYSLMARPNGQVSLERATRESTDILDLPGEVLDAEQADSGQVWLSARGDIVVFGVGGHAWGVRWDGDGWDTLTERLAGVVHAAPLVVQGRDRVSQLDRHLQATTGPTYLLRRPHPLPPECVATRLGEGDQPDHVVLPPGSDGDSGGLTGDVWMTARAIMPSSATTPGPGGCTGAKATGTALPGFPGPSATPYRGQTRRHPALTPSGHERRGLPPGSEEELRRENGATNS